MNRVRTLAGLILLCGGPFAAGCDAVTPQAAEGFVRIAGGGVSYECPTGWQPVPEDKSPQGWTAICETHENGQTIGQVGVFIAHSASSGDVIIASEAAFLGLERNGEDVERISQGRTDVSNAKEAFRRDYTYAAVFNGRRSGQTVRGTDVTVVGEQGQTATVRITGMRGRLTDDLVDHIVKSTMVR